MKVKDFISCAIFSVLSMLGMLVAAITNVSGYTTVLYPVISAFFLSMFLVILLNKVPKKGAIIIYSLVPAIYFLTTGLLEGFIGIVSMLAFSVLAEFVIANNYTDPRKINLACIVYTMYCSTIGLVECFVFTREYCDRALEMGINASVVDGMRKMYSIKPLWAVIILLTALFSYFGSRVANSMIKKHLGKVGLV